LQCRGFVQISNVPQTLNEVLLQIDRARPLVATVDAVVRQRGLSDRQREILFGVLEGLADKEIEIALGISRSTVRTMLRRIGQRMGVRTRVEILSQVIQGLCVNRAEGANGY
jgi:DNA-binding NarL/FixJ family response regulator